MDAEKAFDLFNKTYDPKYLKTALCLQKDCGELMAFFDFPASIGRASAPATQLNPRLPQSGIAPSAQGAAFPTMVCCIKCLSSENAPSKTGESYAALSTWPKSSQASRSKTELKPQNPARSPNDQQSSNTRFDKNSIQTTRSPQS